jgi:YD repeat-containing protein
VVKDGSNNVSQWTDVSGHGFHVLQNTLAEWRPAWVASAMNGKPALAYNGAMTLATTVPVDLQAGANDVTVIAVVKPDATQPSAPTVLYWGSDSNGNFGLTGNYGTNQYALTWVDGNQNNVGSPRAIATAGQVQILGAVKNATNATIYLNGALQGSGTVPATMGPVFSPMAIGDNDLPRRGYAGQIAEVLVYNRALSDTERQQIEAALTAKYVGGGGTDPDSDHNGLPDAWEQQYFGHIGVDPSADPDGDGLTNLQEYTAGSNPVDYYNGRAFVIGSTTGGSGTVAYTYDASGRVTLADYSSGRTIQFTHDAATNLTTAASTGIGGTIAAWRTAHSLPVDGSGNGADTAILAGDGLPNLAKYAFGLDPHVAATADHPIVSFTNVSGSDCLTLTYSRPDPMAADLTYKVEVSANGTTWTSGAGATVAVSTTVSSGIATVVVRDATPAGSPTFGRRITLSIERRAQP